ncbi:MAG: TIGR04283 family arsenosugar biosynthesis glycosyltransferase [Betaproteobacteria bacterium]|nr:TIGR04283 family arsenosugar biosynthesis glycosyltransferase [Betaproteobacteria bacterium]
MISVVIPAYNEERALPGTLAGVHGQPGDYEVIVVDGGSTDRTREIALGAPPTRLVAAPKGRASQMNAGARMARGEWLLFLHADTLLPKNALTRLGRLAADGCLAAGFRHRFSGDDWRLRFISRVDNLRAAHTRVIYGDQGLFIQRRLFWELDGFPPVPMLEDVMFCEKLLKVARPALLPDYVVTDSRKFLKMGVWKSLFRVAAILIAHRLHRPLPSRIFFGDVR